MAGAARPRVGRNGAAILGEKLAGRRVPRNLGPGSGRGPPDPSCPVMEARQLKIFCTVAHSGGLAAAATKVHLTSSAISHSLKALETELGCRLFERAGKRMLLNQAGEQLLAQVEGPLAALDAAAASLKRLGKWGQTRLRLGTAASACQHFLPTVIRELKKRHPRLELQVKTGDIPDLLELLRANAVDVALGVKPELHPGFEVRPVFRDELMFVFAPSHPWADGHPLSRDELRTQPLILYHRSSPTTRLVDEFFRRHEIAPSTIMEVGSIAGIKELVKLNLGVSVLAPWSVDRELARGSLKMRPLEEQPVVWREWAVVWLAGRRLNLAEETFCRLCHTLAAGLRLDRNDVAGGRR